MPACGGRREFGGSFNLRVQGLHLVCVEDPEVGYGGAGVASAFCKEGARVTSIQKVQRRNIPAAEADSSMCKRDGMLFHSARLSLSSSISFSRMPISLDMSTNSA